MDSTTSLPPIRRANAIARRARGGFSLVEVMVSTALAGVVLAGVMASFLMLGRSGNMLLKYTEMEGQARIALERLAQDVREANEITWKSASEIVLGYEDATDVTYELVETTPGHWSFARNDKPVITGVAPDSFNLVGYTIAALAIPLDKVAPTEEQLNDASRSTKQLQLTLRAARTGAAVTSTSNTVNTARFIHRNKRVTL